MDVATDQSRLVEALARSGVLGGATPAGKLETHISFVLLTGTYAYKIKKAVDFGFLDFTTLAARRFFCDEELRLNRRLAPELYLEVVPITGTVDAPVVGGPGPALEYAVKMREFPQNALASRLLAAGLLEPADIDSLAARVAEFHGGIAVAAADGAFGASDEILRLAQRNFEVLAPLLATSPEQSELDELRAWTEREHAARRGAFLRRRQQGFVRECHGDLHLNNIARIDGEIVIFDGIEFNEAMRWIDVMSELAFTVMDLEDRGRADLAHRFLNAYLERTGDHAGLAVLPFYLAYRALVRAKIAASACDTTRRRHRGQPGARGVARLPAARPALCGASAAGIDHHVRALGLRQDGDISGIARNDRRGTRAERRRAQASSRGRCDRAIRRRHHARTVFAGGDRGDV